MLLRSLHFLLLWPVSANTIDSSGDTTSLTVNQNFNQVAAFDHGDVVGEYKLEQRLDYLGSETEWFHDNHPGQKLLVAPDNRSPEIVQSSTFGYLTVEKEIRMNVNASCIRNGTYCLDQHIFRGGHGEIWRARQILPGGIVDQKSSFILKRMHVKDRPDILKCARREIFFGEKLRGVVNVARFITFFHTDDDYW
jgi:hypothetical protein